MKNINLLPHANRTRFLMMVNDLITTERVTNYGTPEDSFKDIAKLWSTYLDKNITSNDVSIMMCLLKIARIKNNAQHDDSYLDAAGYLACGYGLLKKPTLIEKLKKIKRRHINEIP